MKKFIPVKTNDIGQKVIKCPLQKEKINLTKCYDCASNFSLDFCHKKVEESIESYVIVCKFNNCNNERKLSLF